MKNNKSSIVVDLSLISLFLTMFICATFIALDIENININIFILSIIFIIMIVTYFIGVRMALAIDFIFIFLLLSIAIYLGISKGFKIPEYIFFWIVISPLSTVIIALFTKSNLQLQKETSNLQKKLSELVTIDDVTGLKNQHAFIQDTQVYILISQRYSHELMLIVIELRHKTEIERILGKHYMKELFLIISKILVGQTRKEDLIYMIDNDKAQWSILMMTNDTTSIKMIVERIKKEVSQIKFHDSFRFESLNIEIRIGSKIYYDEIKTPLEFLESAKKEMEYSV